MPVKHQLLNDCIHFYLGAEIVVSHNNQPDYTSILTPAFIGDPSGVKPILRKIESLSNEEKSACPKLSPDKWGIPIVSSMAAVVNYLRSIHVDCDGLIESGQAIDREEYKQFRG